jgi:hypothetical protein
LAEEVEFIEFDFEVLDRPGRDTRVIGVAMVVAGDKCGGGFEGLIRGFISSVADI